MGKGGTMRILLIEAGGHGARHLHEHSLLHLGSMAGSLREGESRHDIRIAFTPSAHAAAEVAGAYRPDLVGLSSLTHCFDTAGEIAEAVKKVAPVPIVVVGDHISARPDCLTADMDLAVLGEAETTFSEVVAAMESSVLCAEPMRDDAENARPHSETMRNDSGISSNLYESVRDITGIAFYHQGWLHRTESRKPIEPLDRIPPMAWDLLGPTWELLAPIGHKACVLTSRGEGGLTFSSQAFDRSPGKIRYNSPERILVDVKALLQVGIHQIHFSDPCFASDAARLEKLAPMLAGIRFKKTVYSCRLLAEDIDPQRLDLLKTMGVKQIHLGPESACPMTRKLLWGNEGDAPSLASCIERVHSAGFDVEVTAVIGAPEETRDKAEETIRCVAGDAVRTGRHHLLVPLPGTTGWELAASKGLVDSEMEWSRLHPDFTRSNEKAVLLSETMNFFELWGIHEKLLHIWNLKSLDIRRKQREEKRPLKRWRRRVLASFGIRPSTQSIRFKEMPLAKKHCRGQGLEIGASAQNPFGLNSQNVDLPGVAEVFEKHQEALAQEHVPVDIEAPADDLPVPDASQDYVIHSHVLEHLPDPIKGLKEWDRVVRPGGVVFMIVPHMDRTLDRFRPRTPLSHVIEDYEKGTTLKDEPRVPGAHYHFWFTEDVVELIEWMDREGLVDWEIVEVEDVDSKVGNGFTIICRKR